MKRSQFCKKLIGSGLVCGCAMSLSPVVNDKSPGLPGPENETPCKDKMDFTAIWVKRFFGILDEQIDEKTRYKLMQTNGRECARGAYGDLSVTTPASIEQIDKTIALWQEKLGKDNIYRKDNLVYFNYVGNPKGLKISDGYCLCPMVENAPAIISSTFCQCSVGYVKFMFQKMITLKPVEVRLLESLRGGGKACRFEVNIS